MSYFFSIGICKTLKKYFSNKLIFFNAVFLTRRKQFSKVAWMFSPRAEKCSLNAWKRYQKLLFYPETMSWKNSPIRQECYHQIHAKYRCQRSENFSLNVSKSFWKINFRKNVFAQVFRLDKLNAVLKPPLKIIIDRSSKVSHAVLKWLENCSF